MQGASSEKGVRSLHGNNDGMHTGHEPRRDVTSVRALGKIRQKCAAEHEPNTPAIVGPDDLTSVDLRRADRQPCSQRSRRQFWVWPEAPPLESTAIRGQVLIEISNFGI